MSYINSWEKKGNTQGYKGKLRVVRKSRFKVSKSAKITDFMDIRVQTDSSEVEINFLKTN